MIYTWLTNVSQILLLGLFYVLITGCTSPPDPSAPTLSTMEVQEPTNVYDRVPLPTAGQKIGVAVYGIRRSGRLVIIDLVVSGTDINAKDLSESFGFLVESDPDKFFEIATESKSRILLTPHNYRSIRQSTHRTMVNWKPSPSIKLNCQGEWCYYLRPLLFEAPPIDRQEFWRVRLTDTWEQDLLEPNTVIADQEYRKFEVVKE